MYFLIFSIVIEILCTIWCLVTRILLPLRSQDENINIVLPNDFILFIGIICGWVFSGIAIGAAIDQATNMTLVMFSLFIWLGMFLMFGWLGNVICYDKEGFERGRIPGFKHYYRYEDITSWKNNNLSQELYLKNKKITFEFIMIESSLFLAYALGQYRKIYGKNPPRNNSIPKWDIFNGHVEQPGEMIFVLIIVFLLSFVLPGIMLHSAFDYEDASNTEYIETEFFGHDIEADSLVFQSEEYKETFQLYYYEEYERSQIEEILKLVDSRKRLQINVKSASGGKNTESYFVMYSIKDIDGKTYLDFKDSNEVEQKVAYELLPFCLILTIILWGFIVATIIIGRNPDKFSKRVQRMFFKDGYLH